MTPRALSKLGRRFDAVDSIDVGFKIMPHHERGVVGILPRTELDDRKAERFEGPLDGFAINTIPIRGRANNPMADERLNRSVVNKLPGSIALHCKERV